MVIAKCHHHLLALFLSLSVAFMAQADTLSEKIEQAALETHSVQELSKLRATAVNELNNKAFASLSQEILSRYLKNADYYSFDNEIEWLESHDFWSSSPEVQLVTLIEKANRAFRTSDIDVAIAIQKEAIALTEQYSITARLGEVYSRMGVYYRNQGNLEKAKTLYEKALEIAKQQGDDIQYAQMLMNLGVVHEARNEFNQALSRYQTALPVFEQYNDDTLLADCLFNLTTLYGRMSNFEQALVFALRVLQLDKKLGDIANIIQSHNKVGELHHMLGNREEAMFHIDETIKLSKKSNNLQFLSIALMRKGYAYHKQNNPADAFKYANLSAEIAIQLNSPVHRNNIFPPLASLYVGVGEYQKAIDIVNQVNPDEQTPSQKIRKHTLLAKAHNELENYAEAYTHLAHVVEATNKKYLSQLDAYEEEMSIELAKFAEELKVKDLELENEKSQSELEVMQYRQYFGITLSLIVFLLLSVFVYSQIKKKQLAQAQAKLKEAAVDHKNQMLSDICHELRTPFSVLKLQIEALQHNLEPDTEQAHNRLNEKIEQLSHLVSDIDQLSQADSMVLTLNKVSIKASSLIGSIVTDNKKLVEKIGLELKQDIQLNQYTEIELDITRIQQVFHNLFSNAIRYTNIPGHIRLKARNSATHLFVQIDDTAPGVSKDDLPYLFDRLYRVEKSRSRATGGLGLGLSICKSLIELHQGTIIAKQGKSGGLCIRIELPLVASTQ